MKDKVAGLPQLLLGLALLAALCWNLAYANEINALRVDAGATGTRAELAVPAGTAYTLITLANPHRLVVDLPGVELGKQLAMPSPAGLVKAIRTGHPVPGTTRVVFDLAAPVAVAKPRFEDGPGGTRLVLEWPGDGAGDPIARIASAAAAKATTVPAAQPLAARPPSDAITVAASGSGTPATAAPASSEAEQSAASAAATARLVAAMARTQATVPADQPARSAAPAAAPIVASTVAAGPAVPADRQQGATAPPRTPVPIAGQAPPPAPTASVPANALPTVTIAPGTIATGVPTRIATGVPTPMNPPSDAERPMQSAPAPRRSLMPGMRPLVVAIDPGHGGQDPGAVGQMGKREKDVTLAIGRELARQINATPGLKAYMTRDTDVFIPLPRRAQLARAAKADIFVSIHADAAENRSARGSSVYVLSLKGASSQRARWLADKENSADLIGGRVATVDNTLASVLLDLTQSGHMKASEDAADHVLTGLRRVGSNHKPQIERANFAVLRTSDMPSMLVETAFISNPDEERRLTDPAAQRELASAILGGIDGYFQQQPPPGTMYATRATAPGKGGGSP